MIEEIVKSKKHLNYDKDEFYNTFKLNLKDYYEEGVMLALGFDIVKFSDDLSQKHLSLEHFENDSSCSEIVNKFYGDKAVKLIERLIA